MDLVQKILKRKMRFEDIVETLRQMAVEAELAEERFIRACMAFEDSELWREGAPARDAVFSQFLRRVVEIDPSRYERGALALRDPDLSRLAPVWGMSAVGAIAEVQGNKARMQAMASMQATFENQKRPLSERTARSVVRESVGGKIRVSRDAVRREQIAEVERELSAARRRIRQLEVEVKTLRERLGDAGVGPLEIKRKSKRKQHRSKSASQVSGNA